MRDCLVVVGLSGGMIRRAFCRRGRASFLMTGGWWARWWVRWRWRARWRWRCLRVLRNMIEGCTYWLLRLEVRLLDRWREISRTLDSYVCSFGRELCGMSSYCLMMSLYVLIHHKKVFQFYRSVLRSLGPPSLRSLTHSLRSFINSLPQLEPRCFAAKIQRLF